MAHHDPKVGDQIIQNASKIKPPSRTKLTSNMIRPNRNSIKGKDINIPTKINTDVKDNVDQIENMDE